MKRPVIFLNFKFLIIGSIAFLASDVVLGKELKSYYQIKDAVEKVSATNLMDQLRQFISATKPSRMVGSAGHSKAQEYIQSFLEEKGSSGKTLKQTFNVPKSVAIKLYEDDFKSNIVPQFPISDPTYIKWKGFLDYIKGYISNHSYNEGMNIIWSKKGTSDKTLVLVAHYDTIAQDKKTFKILDKENLQGADYNGSGVSLLLSLIEVLDKVDLKNSVQIVFLDYQGLGFLGSYEHAKSIAPHKEKVFGVVNLEMLGHDSRHFDKSKKYGNMAVYLRSQEKDPAGADTSFLKDFSRIPKQKVKGVSFKPVRNDFNQSDNFRYWDVDLPCVTFSQNWEEDFNARGFQSSNDFVETVNHKTFHASYKYVATGTLVKLLNID